MGKEDQTFCPIIKDKCKKEECKFWISEDCVMVHFFESQVIEFINKSEAMQELSEKRKKKEENYSFLEEGSEEDLSKELVEYALKEVPNEKYLSHFVKNMFWKIKGIESTYDLPSQLKLKVERVENKAETQKRQEVEKQEKLKLDTIIEDCLKWAKENGATKLTKSDVNAYVMDSEKSLTQASKDILYSKVNMRLKK